MSLILLVAGLILLLAGSGWFAGAATVGLILAIVGGVLLVLEIAWGGFLANQFRKTWKDF